jgi:hypothetical protein
VSNNLAPVLLIGFNRPQTLKVVIDVLRNVKPNKVYFAVDGPRKGKKGEDLLVQQVRDMQKHLDWGCEVKTLFRSKNLGCGEGVKGAISWFFEHEEAGIIVEDDVVLAPEFFNFASQMLNRYQAEDAIKAVLAFNLHGQKVTSDSYFFYEGYYPWGWATWKRAWQEYLLYCDKPGNELVFGDDKAYRDVDRSLKLNLNLINRGLLDTWDYQFLYMLRRTKGLSLVPYANLSKNIGVDGAHSHGNVLDFSYGTMNLSSLDNKFSIEIDKDMNNLYMQEHRKVKYLNGLKLFILKINAYPILKKMVRFFRGVL